MAKINSERHTSTKGSESALRVAHLTSVHHPFDPRIFHKQCKTLRDAGFDVHLVAQHTHSETVDGIALSALPEVSGRYARIALQAPLYRRAYALQADVYHIHDPELIPLLWLLKRTTGASVIYDMHEDYASRAGLEGRLLRALERWCFRWVDQVVIAEASYKSSLTDTSSYCYIPNYHKPYPPHHTKELELKSDHSPLRLLYTGVLSQHRGLGTMIEVARQVRARRLAVRMDWVGICNIEIDRQRAELQIEVHDLSGIIQQVGWNRYVLPEAMGPYYRAAHVGLCLMHPHDNYVRSIPTKFYEYLYHGLPIICSDFPLWQSFIERHGCGVAVPPGDAEAVVSALQRWMDDPAQYQAYAKRAREAADQFQWEDMGDRLVTLYKKMIA